MRTPRLAIIAGALASVFVAGTAHAAVAAPASKPALAKNPIHKTGRLALRTCEEPPVQSGTEDEARVYFEAVLECLDKAWGPKVKQAGFAFGKPKFRVITKAGAPTGCGPFPGDEQAQALYCPVNKTMTLLLSPNVVAKPSDPVLMLVVAHEYGHHVQKLTGMLRHDKHGAYVLANPRSLEPVRRAELQAECYAGAFMGSVWDSLGRSQKEFDSLLKGTHDRFDVSALGIKTRSSADLSHGSDANVVWWLKRGFTGRSAGSCNTWAAPKSRVS
ncbi:neutral zinc metallopeptidase [Nonomuraea sp. NPDC049637]|uniref:neutral zinc metallopeptidase n=1 Tax=Nonomuraea sp. NPDC049637 TaxID=3154356 RepID=UPI003412AFBC